MTRLALVVPTLDGIGPEVDRGLASMADTLDADVELHVLANGPAGLRHPGAMDMGGNLGFGRAVNRWFEERGGGFDGFVLINDDVVVNPDGDLTRFVVGCIEGGGVGAVLGDPRDVHPLPTATMVVLSLCRLQAVTRRLRRRSPVVGGYPSAYCWVIARERFGEHGFDDRYPLYYEDAALAEVWAAEGRSIEVLVTSAVQHRRSATFKSGSPGRRQAILQLQAYSGHRWLTVHGMSSGRAFLLVAVGLAGRVVTGLPESRGRCVHVLRWWLRNRGRSVPALPDT